MTIEGLNARFGTPGKIVFRPGHCGYPNAVIASKYGVAEIALLGGNVVSYRPTGHGEVLFRPAKRDYNRADSYHGGVPVCWPQFGNRFDKSLPQHGFARKLLFEVRSMEYSEDMTELTLGLRSDEATRSLWPHDFDLELKVSVSMKLNFKLTTKNTGSKPFAFSCGFHPYLLVRERDLTTVRGLDGAAYVDGRDPELKKSVWKGELKVDFAPDHIFTLPPSPKHEFAVLDPSLRRAIAIVSSGNDCAIVWNCGEEHPMSDFEAGDWRKYVCVEPVSDWPGGRELAPGAKHELLMAIQASLEGADNA